MFNSDFISGFVVVAITILAYYQGNALSYLGGVFVWSLLVILAVLGLSLFVKGFISPEKIHFVQTKTKLQPVLYYSLSMILYLALIPWVGFLLASILFFSVTIWLLERNSQEHSPIVHSISTGIGVSVLFFIAFKYGLLVPLPGGLFWG